MARRFTIFDNVKAQGGRDCTYEVYLEVANSEKVLRICNRIAAEEDPDKRGDIKKLLPAVTWQAAFDGRRANKNAKPSGLFMLDIDHVENPFELYSKKIAKRVQELGIVYVGKTASTKGLRIVAKCLPTLNTLEDCQRWLASNLKVKFDSVCKDWARSSFLVHDSYTYYMDAKAIWQEDPAEGEVYPLEPEQVEMPTMEAVLADSQRDWIGESKEANKPFEENKEMEEMLDEAVADQREGLFGGPTDYKGIPYDRICKVWLEHTGGEPTKGERNTRLYKLATRMRYITDFNEAVLTRIMPTYGLPDSEVRQLVHSAMQANRASDMPLDLRETLDIIDKQIKIQGDAEDDEIPEIITSTDKMPSLPPLLRQWYDIAPADFKAPVTLCQLPILGALGSKLRARYLDGKMHSPTFNVSLEAPQASGKSFLVRLVDTELRAMKESDEAQRELERQYSEKVAEMKMLNIKVNVDNKDEILGQKPKGIIRFVPATMSITKLLMRMEGAQGLHLFALGEEIDTVYKAFKRGFSSYSDALRVAFDNGEYGQDYASDNSWSGNIRLYYNVLFSGTPKAMRRFYPDVEDGLVSRVLFVTLPDQFGKPMPIWKEMTDEQQRICDIALTRLSEISLQGTEVQPDHVMKLDWLNKAMDLWVKAQQAEAVRTEDRTRDAFCRRSAVVGFRAGMLAWFLWGEHSTPAIRRNTCDFAIWVANSMLNQHILRFNITSTHSNVNKQEEMFDKLPQTFTRKEVEEMCASLGVDTPVRGVLYRWKLLGIIEPVEKGRGENNKSTYVKFKKTHK